MALKEIMNSPTKYGFDVNKKIGTNWFLQENWNRYIHHWFGSFAKAQGINYKILKFTILGFAVDWETLQIIHNRNSIKQLLIWNRLEWQNYKGQNPAL
jgi:hypothetical protein